MPLERNLLGGGLSLTLRSWPALVWTYVFNLGLAVLFTLPLHQQIGAITAHSLASQRLTGAFDLGAMGGVIAKLYDGPGPATSTSYFSTPIYLVLYFLIVPGTLFCYQTGNSASLFALLQSGFAHFWRFVRITLVSLVISGPILAGLFALQKLWAAHVDVNTVERPAVLLKLAGLVLIGLVAAALRLYFDLMQVYTVQLGQQLRPEGADGKTRPEHRIRRAFKPAWRTFRRNFFRAYPTFILLAVLALAAVVLTARFGLHSLAQPRVWPMFLVAQLGLFLMLLTRFWQRGAETILALDNPIPASPVIVAEPVLPQELLPDTPAVDSAPAEVENDEVPGTPNLGTPNQDTPNQDTPNQDTPNSDAPEPSI
jgi:hypothetical protein